MCPALGNSSNRAPGISSAIRRDSAGGVITSDVPQTTSVGRLMVGSALVRSRLRSAWGASRLVSAAHAAII